MYGKHYGLKEAPFHVTPDPRFLYKGTDHRRAIAHLTYGIKERKGFLLLTGEVGCGKTTVCRALLEDLAPPEHRTAYVFAPNLDGADLLRAILRDLGREPGATHLSDLLHELHEFLVDEYTASRNVVLVVDEAQNLSPSALETIRLISNLETTTTKLVQVLLSGQPEIDETLGRKEMRQLRQRVAVRCILRPFTREETEAYIRHRFTVAGYEGSPLFGKKAVEEIFERSGGVPRLINSLCDASLLEGAIEGTTTIDAAIVVRAAEGLALGRRPSMMDRLVDRPAAAAPIPVSTAAAPAAPDEEDRPGRAAAWGDLWRRGLGWAAAAACGATVVGAYLAADAVAARGGAKVPPPAAEDREEIREMNAAAAEALAAQTPSGPDSAATCGTALERLLALRWKVGPTSALAGVAETEAFGPTAAAAVATLGLKAVTVGARTETLLVLDEPCLIEVSGPGGRTPVLLVEPRPGAWVVETDRGTETWTDAELRSRWTGRALYVIRPRYGWGERLEGAGPAVRQAQVDLATLGFYRGEPTGSFDTATANAVRSFRRAFECGAGETIGGASEVVLWRVFEERGRESTPQE